MESAYPWPDLPAGEREPIELMEEVLATTTQTPADLRARAAELRAEAAVEDINGYRNAMFTLAGRYEETAARIAAGRQISR